MKDEPFTPQNRIISTQAVGRAVRAQFSARALDQLMIQMMGVPRSYMRTTHSEEAYNRLKGNFPLGPFQRLD